MNRDW